MKKKIKLFDPVIGNSEEKEIVKILNLEKKIKITKVNSDYFKDVYFVKRPNSENLINYYKIS